MRLLADILTPVVSEIFRRRIDRMIFDACMGVSTRGQHENYTRDTESLRQGVVPGSAADGLNEEIATEILKRVRS